MSEEFTYSTYEVDQIVAKKDAEIERLKAEKQHLGIECISYIGQLAESQIEIERLKAELTASRKVSDGWYNKNQEHKSLITELADALTSQDRPETPPFLREDHELIQKAREAVK
jgi:uncharacterized small protein (DUF1192 family)